MVSKTPYKHWINLEEYISKVFLPSAIETLIAMGSKDKDLSISTLEELRRYIQENKFGELSEDRRQELSLLQQKVEFFIKERAKS